MSLCFRLKFGGVNRNSMFLFFFLYPLCFVFQFLYQIHVVFTLLKKCSGGWFIDGVTALKLCLDYRFGERKKKGNQKWIFELFYFLFPTNSINQTRPTCFHRDVIITCSQVELIRVINNQLFQSEAHTLTHIDRHFMKFGLKGFSPISMMV